MSVVVSGYIKRVCGERMAKSEGPLPTKVVVQWSLPA
jgi:hypothetical protein